MRRERDRGDRDARDVRRDEQERDRSGRHRHRPPVWHDRRVRIPSPALVVLVGPSGAGKSTWAAAHFARRRGRVQRPAAGRGGRGRGRSRGLGRRVRACSTRSSTRRLRRGLTAVVDTLGLDADRRRGLASRSRRGTACRPSPSCFDTPAATCRARNRGRAAPVPGRRRRRPAARVRGGARRSSRGEGFAACTRAGPVRSCRPALGGAGRAAAAAQRAARGSASGCSVSRFDWPGGRPAIGGRGCAASPPTPRRPASSRSG